MPAPKALSLPKPILFGLYGASGGLLGALLFGELIMLVLSPPKADAGPPPPPEPRLAVVASSELQIYQGGTNKLFVQILRDAFDDDVTVHVEGLPAGITARGVTIPAKEDQAEIELRANRHANSNGLGNVQVVATAKTGGKTVQANTGFKVTTLMSAMPQADIVFVLDVTGSMQKQIDGLKQGIGTFSRDLFQAKVDARFACLAFRDLTENERSQLLKFQGETFTSDAGVFRDEVAKLRADGGGDPPESSFEAISEAAGIPDWRKLAVRTLILITDAPPKIVVNQGQLKAVTIKSLRDNKIDFLHLVVRPDEQPIYREIQEGAIGSGEDKGMLDRGKVFDLETVARDPDVMTNHLLPEMTKAIVAAVEARRPDAKPELAPPPPKPELPVVKGVQSSEKYEKSSSGRLVLAVGVWTGAIAALVCLFLMGGQHYYLRGNLPAVGGILAALAGGGIVGLVGGAAGQALFLLANTDSTVVDAIFRILGWTILGSLAGLGLSLFVPNLKLVYGLGGGAIGGAVGAIGFLVVSGVLRGVDLPPKLADVLGRLAGGLALGLFIGLMVAMVEVAFRRAWLEVRYGPREMVTVNLGPEPVKIGSDAKACTVWARGAAGVALRYFIRDGKVICNDVPGRAEHAVNDGDERAVGNVTVVVRTGSGAESPERGRRSSPPPVPKNEPQVATAARKEEPRDLPPLLDLGDDDRSPMPLPAAVSSPPAPPKKPPTPSAPPAPKPQAAPHRPPAPPIPKSTAPQAASPAASAAAPKPKDPDACPTCGRKMPGRPGSRYCMVCDQTY